MSSEQFAEQLVVVSLLANPGLLDTIDSNLQQRTFENEQFGLIYGAISALYRSGRPVDEVTVSVAAGSDKITVDFIRELRARKRDFTLPDSLSTHAQAICAARYAEFVQKTASKIHALSVDPALRLNRPALAQEISGAVLRLNTASDSALKGTDTYRSMMPGYLKKMKERALSSDTFTGLPTGIPELDAVTLGLQRKDLIIVAARPSMGKTTFALNLIEEPLRRGMRALVFSMEMPSEQLLQRSLANVGSIDVNHLRSGKLTSDELERLSKAVEITNDWEMEIDDSPSLPIGEVMARSYRAHQRRPVDIIMLDYIQLMNGSGEDNRNSQIEQISRGLKQLAKDLDAPVIALSQLNRGLETRANKRPMMSDLRDSGAIEQDADVAFFLYRDEVYNADSPDVGTAEVIIGKQRNGPLATIRTKFEGRFSRFAPLPPGASASFSGMPL